MTGGLLATAGDRFSQQLGFFFNNFDDKKFATPIPKQRDSTRALHYSSKLGT
ncbi:hypothetical protein K2173_026315 [Erythroxylum novogranatense]|uniref:Uncharacterized protein n=1 Tax=Erythroxylum novogranatense TaxID=1862640 RepID=A0AAV8SBQ7_9ROSI|nr:hypothetical protein K2173_026315 [Erythroxylum novogranatense]